MKYSLNIVKFMVCMCVFLNTPLLTYAKGKHCSDKKHSSKSSKRDKGCKCVNTCKVDVDQDVDVKQKQKQGFNQENPVTVTTPITVNMTSSDTDTNTDAATGGDATNANLNILTQAQVLALINAACGSCNGSTIINNTIIIEEAGIFGGWFVPANATVDVDVGTKVPFLFADNTPTGITNAGGSFTFPTAGTYQATVGIAAIALVGDAHQTPFFDLVRNPGATQDIIKEINGDIFNAAGINPVTVQFTVAAGDVLELQYVGSVTTNVTTATVGGQVDPGPNPSFEDFAFIEFKKIS